MLAAADLQRPAAIEQLQIVSEQANKDLPVALASCFTANQEFRRVRQGRGRRCRCMPAPLAAARTAGVDVPSFSTPPVVCMSTTN